VSAVSTKIAKANISRDSLRTRSRRYKALWTLYTSFAYILYSAILLLVTGQSKWGSIEYTAIVAGPLLIYAVRVALSAYYNFRLSGNQDYLDVLNKQKNEAVEKFKKATKYNTTQELLEKYGAVPPSTPEDRPSSGGKRKSVGGSGTAARTQPGRTGFAPPPTANIRRPGDIPSLPSTSNQPSPYNENSGVLQSSSPIPPFASDQIAIGAEFAPNAHTSAPQYSNSSSGHPAWYDRIMDVLLGEDETRPINRLALICSHCKLVNGQAPPGTKRLEDLGRWRCSSCRGWNGEESEVHKIIEQAKITQDESQVSPAMEQVLGSRGKGASVGEAKNDDDRREADESDVDDAPPAKSTRSHKKARNDRLSLA